MRIIAGQYRSRILKTLPTNDTRPTLDQVKESFFSSIGNLFDGGVVLDLFSGCGAIALECISRGFDKAICVDNNIKACQIIQDNINTLKCNNQVKVMHCDYLTVLKSLQQSFDLIYIDPPYIQQDYYLKSIQLICDKHLLSDNGIIACEVDQSLQLQTEYDQIYLWKEKKYRHNKIYIYKKRLNESKIDVE